MSLFYIIHFLLHFLSFCISFFCSVSNLFLYRSMFMFFITTNIHSCLFSPFGTSLFYSLSNFAVSPIFHSISVLMFVITAIYYLHFSLPLTFPQPCTSLFILFQVSLFSIFFIYLCISRYEYVFVTILYSCILSISPFLVLFPVWQFFLFL